MAHEKLLIPPPFEEVMRQYERDIMRYLIRVSGDLDDAADLFQETWLRAYRAYPRLQPGSDVRPWLYAIATNLCRNRARDHARRSRVIVPENKERPVSNTTGERSHQLHEGNGYALLHIRELISQLPIKQRQAVYLRYFGGLEYTEIATALDCSQESARANVSQAMRKLKAAW